VSSGHDVSRHEASANASSTTKRDKPVPRHPTLEAGLRVDHLDSRLTNQPYVEAAQQGPDDLEAASVQLVGQAVERPIKPQAALAQSGESCSR
jgi:hypothetical protein